MIEVTIQRGAGLTRSQSNACYTRGQKQWWIRDLGVGASVVRGKPVEGRNPRFLDIGLHPAHHPLACTLSLHTGSLYLLGCGTGHSRLRKLFTVDLMGVKWL
jgi:hypothetical protein